MEVRALRDGDADAIRGLLVETAGAPDSGLARGPGEITAAYARKWISDPANGRLAFGADRGGRLEGVIVATRMAPLQFRHVLSDLTVAVRPGAQGRGVGTALFAALLSAAAAWRPPVSRVELFVRSGNLAAIRLYERLGFQVEGRFIGRVRLPSGVVEDDIAMALALTPGRGA